MAKKRNKNARSKLSTRSGVRKTNNPRVDGDFGKSAAFARGAGFALGARGRQPAYDTVKPPAAVEMERYIAAAINPFDAPVGCMPKSPGLHSSKHKVWAKTLMQANSSGFCFAVCRPGMANDHGTASGTNFFPLAVSDNTFVGTTLANDAVTAGVTGVELNSLFVHADFGDSSLHGRVISRGLRARYTGKELDRGGRILAFRHPQGESVDGTTLANLLQYPTAETVAVTRQWKSICSHPVHDAETEYSTASQGPQKDPSMCIMVAGATPNVQFEVEYYVHFEVVGPTLGTSVTESIADDGTFAKVQATLLHYGTKFYDYATGVQGAKLTRLSANLLYTALRTHSADALGYVMHQLAMPSPSLLTW